MIAIYKYTTNWKLRFNINLSLFFLEQCHSATSMVLERRIYVVPYFIRMGNNSAKMKNLKHMERDSVPFYMLKRFVEVNTDTLRIVCLLRAGRGKSFLKCPIYKNLAETTFQSRLHFFCGPNNRSKWVLNTPKMFLSYIPCRGKMFWYCINTVVPRSFIQVRHLENYAGKLVLGIFQAAFRNLYFYITMMVSLKSFEDITDISNGENTSLIHAFLRLPIWAWRPCKQRPQISQRYYSTRLMRR